MPENNHHFDDGHHHHHHHHHRELRAIRRKHHRQRQRKKFIMIFGITMTIGAALLGMRTCVDGFFGTDSSAPTGKGEQQKMDDMMKQYQDMNKGGGNPQLKQMLKQFGK